MTTLPIASLWNDEEAKNLDQQGLLLYRTHLLGRDQTFSSLGGSTTSTKLMMKDALTDADVKVLMVKHSHSALGTVGLDGFSSIYLDKLHVLQSRYKTIDQEDSMALDLRHCVFNPDARAPSRDTFMFGFVPHAHVDHVRCDAVNAIAAARDSERLVLEIFGGEVATLPWQRLGIDLGSKIGKLVSQNPKLIGVILGNQGLVTWGETSKSCYETTLRIANKATGWLNTHSKKPAFGGEMQKPLGPEVRRAVALRLMPEIRGLVSTHELKLGHFNDAPDVLEFVNSKELSSFAALGAYCSDPSLGRKIGALVIPPDATSEDVKARVLQYRASYEAYYNRFKWPDSPAMHDPNAAVFLVPQVGMFTFAKDKLSARKLSEFYTSAINVMRGASAISEYQNPPEQDIFNIEYCKLNEAQLSRLPKSPPLLGRVALVTGGANGIGAVIADRLLAAGACVTIADIDTNALNETSKALGQKYGADNIHAVHMDVTNESQIIASFNDVACQFGGLDIVVNNAGIAIRSPVEDTTIEMWDKQVAILGTGYFLVGREGFRLLKRQNMGGSMVFISSKNGLVASEGASAYGAMKAAELHLARCMALEGAPLGIRVNTVAPDAVLRGSKLMAGNFAQKRAEALNIRLDELDEHYRKRSLLQRSVYSEDVAEAVYFFASDLSLKSTGNILNVDSGHVASFTR
jgi:rhamnulose-1-phosphate aldolase/alcohol dehydrogenase